MRFLVVDDSTPIRLMMKAAIEKAGGEAAIEEAADAKTALERFRATPPDVVFLDMNLAGGPGGLDVMTEMLTERPEARIVIVTGLPRSDPRVIDAISNGAAAFIEKPVRTDDVRRVLTTISQESGRSGRIR